MLVDARTSDDAAVYRLDGDRALVVTADFFTPIVDDARDFGRIAAANALSDIYAMGARPLLALNLVGFPRKLLGEGILEAIISGGVEVARAAGIPVLGGHSIDDPEPKYGLCVVGEVHPDRVVRNSTGRAGDALVLTKPIGTGAIATAVKAGAAPPEVVTGAIAWMTTLNRAAAEAMVRHGAHAATDVTGFGLLGHLREMAAGSGLSAVVEGRAVQALPGARELIAAGHIPGGTRRNLEDLAEHVRWGAVDETMRTLLADAQTSGGLLVALPREAAESMVAELAETDAGAAGKAGAPAIIGELREGVPGSIEVR